MDAAIRRKLIETVVCRVIDHSEELTKLDQAIGDGDHGINLKRGCEVVLANIGEVSTLPLPQALQKAGMTLVMNVGGASGPLYGTLFMKLGEELPPEPDRAAAVKALGSAIAAVKARGKSDAGQKTMLDVLVPLHAILLSGSEVAALREGVRRAAIATVPMKAMRGRASFLGNRSIGHMDPGARSSALMVEAVLDVLEGKS